jgi:hypothetical protein
MHVHSPLSPLPYCHYARIIITERQTRSVHYNDVSARDRPTMAARAWARPSPRQLEDLRGRRLPPGASPSCRWLSDEWIYLSPLLGRLRGCIYVLGEPWGELPLAFHEILLGN